MTKNNEEFERFDAMMKKLISVPHEKLKAALDAEKVAKQKRTKKVEADKNDSGN